MRVVIEIPEEYLDQNIIDVSVMPVNREIRDVNVEDKYAEFTVLPEQHGDLVDKDALWDAYHDLDYDFYEAYDNAPTILEGTVKHE